MVNKILLILFFLLWLGSQAFADCILSGPTKITSSSADAFGVIVRQNSTTLKYLHGVIANNASGNSLRFRNFNTSTRAFTSSTTFYQAPNAPCPDDATKDCYNVSGAKGGVIGNNIYIFFARRSDGAAKFYDIVYIKSTDLIGSSWGAPVVVHTFTTPQRGNPDVGNVISTGIAGEYIIPFYHHNGSRLLWHIGYVKTTDSGATWTAYDGAIYSPALGTGTYGESTCVNIGGTKIICHARPNEGGSNLHQTVSLDGGLTWTDYDLGETNIGSGIATGPDGKADIIPHLYYDSTTDRIFQVVMDRGSRALELYYADPDDIINNPTGWPARIILDSNFFYFGYASMEKIGTDLYLIVYSKQTSGNPQITWLLYKAGVCIDPGFSICGNGILEVGEECDDNNTNSGDGCSASCILETIAGVCGDGILAFGEGCDDGNNVSGDGCSTNCQVEDDIVGSGTFSGLIIDGISYE